MVSHGRSATAWSVAGKVAWGALLVPVLALGGCLEFPGDEACRDTADCPAATSCIGGLCQTPVRRGRDAAVGPTPDDDGRADTDDLRPDADAGMADPDGWTDPGDDPDAEPEPELDGPCGLRPAGSAACVACLEEAESTCDALSACAADPVCAATHTCAARCADPSCVAACGESPGADIARITAHTTRFRACSAACELGRDWACVDDFAWGGAVERRLSIRLALLRVPASVPHGGASVRACDLLDHACDDPLAETTANEAGLAELDLDAGMDPLGFTGFFEVDGGDLQPTVVIPAARLVRDGAYLQPVVTARDMRGTILLATGRSPQPGRAVVLVQVRDCRGDPAPRMRLELTTADADYGAVYFNDNLPDPGLDATQVSGLVGFVDVPVTGEGVAATLVARRADTGEAVSRRQVLLRPDRLTFVFLGPDAQD